MLTNVVTSPKKYEYPVDLVYLWCDGAAPEFAARKAARMKEFNPDLIEDNVGAVRYIQHDELQYSLRSAFKNVPWIRHIFIVTDNQRPEWLADHSKITIIDHKDIIPAELLPTFSSIGIEMYLDRIPGLSEHFLYANDDIFFSCPLSVSDFFDSNWRPVVWMRREQEEKITESVADSILRDDSRKDWQKTVIRAWMLYRKKRGLNIHYHSPMHSIDALTKTFFRATLDAFPELKKANAAPFRTGNEISRVPFSYEMINTFGCPVKFDKKKKRNLWGRLRNWLFPVEILATVREATHCELEKLKQEIRIFHPKTFCLNGITADLGVESKVFFESLFPEPAPWEKD